MLCYDYGYHHNYDDRDGVYMYELLLLLALTKQATTKEESIKSCLNIFVKHSTRWKQMYKNNIPKPIKRKTICAIKQRN